MGAPAFSCVKNPETFRLSPVFSPPIRAAGETGVAIFRAADAAVQ
jgi:hypothetical protein